MARKTGPLQGMSDFDVLSHKMFFNIFIHEPDPLVWSFTKKYFPAFTKPAVQGGWTVYPPNFNMPVYEFTVHSFRFGQHPYYDAPYREGRLDIIAKEEKNGKPGVIDFQLWFLFDSKSNANKGFNNLCKMFEKVCDHRKILQRKRRKTAVYANKKNICFPDDVEFILTDHELYNGKYKLFFRSGAFTYDDGFNFGYLSNYQVSRQENHHKKSTPPA